MMQTPSTTGSPSSVSWYDQMIAEGYSADELKAYA
jgi:hypothetical protein